MNPNTTKADYRIDYPQLFDGGHGQEVLSSVLAFIDEAGGEFTSMEVVDDVIRRIGFADAWCVLNALDHVVALGTVRELTDRDEVWGQDRRYCKDDVA